MSDMYKRAGVNLSEAEKLSKLLSGAVLGENSSAFAGGVSCNGFRILNCCDGIGSKIIPLYEHKLYKTIAVDLAAANLNDLATQDAKAVAFSDYIAVSRLDSMAVSQIVTELQKVLADCNCTLVGGETSEIPSLLKEGATDICGFAIGIADDKKPKPICVNDSIIALCSNGIHANGFSLIRKLYSEGKLSEYDFEECLKPSYIYYNSVRKLWENKLIKTGANITGGGILSNLSRIFPDGYSFELDFNKIPPQRIFEKLHNLCGNEVYEVFNCGVGFCIVTDCVSEVLDICRDYSPFILGKVVNE